VAPSTSPTYRFGDLLALARQSWVTQMSAAVEDAGYHGYRRSDPVVLRTLASRPPTLGELGDALGVSRQAARKVVRALERRGYAVLAPDADDARRTRVELTPEGRAYAGVVVSVLDQLNAAVRDRVDDGALAAADTVLRAVFPDDKARADAARLVPPFEQPMR
jgi:DNA-binding MarR family transcriptional regulator